MKEKMTLEEESYSQPFPLKRKGNHFCFAKPIFKREGSERSHWKKVNHPAVLLSGEKEHKKPVEEEPYPQPFHLN